MLIRISTLVKLGYHYTLFGFCFFLFFRLTFSHHLPYLLKGAALFLCINILQVISSAPDCWTFWLFPIFFRRQVLVRDEAIQASAAGTLNLQTFLYSTRYNGALTLFLFLAGKVDRRWRREARKGTNAGKVPHLVPEEPSSLSGEGFPGPRPADHPSVSAGFRRPLSCTAPLWPSRDTAAPERRIPAVFGRICGYFSD